MSTKKLLGRLEEMKSRWAYHDDYSVYTGPAGIAYTFFQYGKCFNEQAYIDVGTLKFFDIKTKIIIYRTFVYNFLRRKQQKC